MLQELTNKIKKILPEIEELKPGQKVLVWSSENQRDKYKIIVSTLSPKGGVIYGYGNGFHERPFNKEWLIEILGRDITLEDVLRCLEDTVAYKVVCSVFKNYLLIGKPSCLNEDAIKWKLNQPLHKQSKETIKELNKLI